MADVQFRRLPARPAFWWHPHADMRLTWVVCFDFSARGNAFFNVLIGPYWTAARLPSREAFPRCVGYSNRLCGNGIDQGNTSWQALPGSFKRAVPLLEGEGRAYFSRFADPAALLAAKPAAQLAFDLADFAQAAVLAERELSRDYAHAHVASCLSPTGQRILRDSLARNEELLRASLTQLGRGDELAAARARASLAAARKPLADITPMLATEPGSRWPKGLMNECQAVIEREGRDVL
jgi:hypothetical protein